MRHIYLHNGVASLICALLLGLSGLAANFVLREEQRGLIGALTLFVNVPLLLFGTIATVLTILQMMRSRFTRTVSVRIVPFILILCYLMFTLIYVLLMT